MSVENFLIMTKLLFTSDNTIHDGVTVHIGKYYSRRSYRSHRKILFTAGLLFTPVLLFMLGFEKRRWLFGFRERRALILR